MDGEHLAKKFVRIKDPPATSSQKWLREQHEREKLSLMARGNKEKEDEIRDAKAAKIEKAKAPKRAEKEIKSRLHRSKLRTSNIPWQLLDELEKEKSKLEEDKASKTRFNKPPRTMRPGRAARRHG